MWLIFEVYQSSIWSYTWIVYDQNIHIYIYIYIYVLCVIYIFGYYCYIYIYGWWFILGIIIPTKTPTDEDSPASKTALLLFPGTAERRASVHCGSEDSCGFGHGEDVQSFRIFHRENIWEMIEMIIWLVSNMTFIFSMIYGMSSNQIDELIFFRGVGWNHQPVIIQWI